MTDDEEPWADEPPLAEDDEMSNGTLARSLVGFVLVLFALGFYARGPAWPNVLAALVCLTLVTALGAGLFARERR